MRQHDERRTGHRDLKCWTMAILPVLGLTMYLGSGDVLAQSAPSGSAIVQDALKDVRQDQAEDARRVRRMIDEAVKGAERAPSGLEAVNPTAPPVLRPLQEAPPGALPTGIAPQDLADKPLRDGAGTEIGRVRDLVLDEQSGLARIVVDFAPMFGEPAKTTVIGVETLQPADAGSDGYIVDLTPVRYKEMPRYAWENGAWRQEGS